jgi:hypothetical protein
MNTKNERTQSGESRPALPPTRPKRFRIAKLEERIAPRRGWGHSKRCDWS